MLLSNHKTAFFIVFSALVLSASGCDRIAAIKEYFTGHAEKPAAAPAAATKAAPVQVKTKPAAAAPMTANTLARVGSWSITVDEFNERLEALKEVVPEYNVNDMQTKQLILEELVNQQVLVIGAEKTGLDRHKDIEAAVDEFRRTLIVREVARQLTENITVSDEEARTFYEENKEIMINPAEWHVREIVVPTKEEATGILGEILQGVDFAEKARLHSKGKTAADGGNLGFITEEPFPQMGAALLALEDGDVSGVFKGPEGYYIVKLEGKKDGEPIGFEDIKTDIIQSQTLLKQQQVIVDHLNNLKAKTKIDINEQLLQ